MGVAWGGVDGWFALRRACGGSAGREGPAAGLEPRARVRAKARATVTLIINSAVDGLISA